jgi:hypothetical protein
MIDDIATISQDQIEAIEKLTTRWIFQAVLDFGIEAYEIFLQSPDEVKDVAEDITREILDRLSGHNISQRIYGTVDYKKARYIILPEMLIRQALFVDSKAEKENRTATIQMSQTSMRVKHIRSDVAFDEVGMLPPISLYNDRQYLTTTAFLHFMYEDSERQHILREVTVFCLPNGMLQDRYNPTVADTIWLAGRNAPTLGEDFRVRLAFNRLKSKAAWRVQKIYYDGASKHYQGNWDE